MKRFVFGILFLLAVLGVFYGTFLLSRSAPLHETRTRGLPVTAVIRSEHPKRRDFSQRLKWFGRVESKYVVKITALADGRIVSQRAENGSYVKKGDLLFTLGGPRVTSRMERLRQSLSSLDKRIELAEIITRARQEAVNEKMMKREEFASAAETLARLKLDQVEAKLRLATFQEAVKVRAPRDGVFTGRRVSIGQEVDRGEILVELLSGGVRVVAFLFPQAKASLEGSKTTVRASSGHVLSGTVKKVLPERSQEGATITWIGGKAFEKWLKPGETVRGELFLSWHREALGVPQGALVRDDRERPFVFLKGSDGWRKQAVKVGLSSHGWVELVSGVKETDEVVVRGAYELFYRGFSRTYKVPD